MLNFIARTYRYAARVRYNNACLLRFSTKYRLVLCNIRPRAIAVIRRRIVSNRVAIQVIFFQAGDIGREVRMEIVL